MRRMFYVVLVVVIAATEMFAQEIEIVPALVADEAVVAQPGQPVPVEEQPVAPVQPAGPQVVDVGDWTIEIAPAGPAFPGTFPSEYRMYYDSIPFSRAEWLANASYRHDSAMSLMTGHPINGRAPATGELERYQNPRTYLRTFFPRLAPADLHYNYAYGRYQYRPWGTWGWYDWAY